MTQPPSSSATTRRTITRRTLAKGTAWAAPSIALGAQVQAVAASGTRISGSICKLFYGSGTINYQEHWIYLGITSSTGTIPKGTTITWNICVSGGGSGTGGTNEVPTTNYSATTAWSLVLTDTSGATLTTGNALPASGCFVAKIVFNEDYKTGAGAGGTWCAPALIWTDIYTIRPGATVTATSNASTGPATAVGSGTLEYTAARRHPNAINTSGRLPHKYVSKSGTQGCYPAVDFSQVLQSDGADDVVCYPAGTAITTSRCNWDGFMCNSSSTGLCTPPYKAAVSGQTTIPAMC